jgi:hypothetical protein
VPISTLRVIIDRELQLGHQLVGAVLNLGAVARSNQQQSTRHLLSVDG